MDVKAYKMTDAAGVLQYRAVVRGTNPGECKKPSAEGEGKFVGITQEAQATQNKSVPVVKRGRTLVTCAGVVAYGDYIYVGDSTGKVKSCQTAVATGLASPAAVIYVIGVAEGVAGADGDQIWADIDPQAVALAVQ